ncbi:MAG: hypothetical protein AABZ02_13345 [Bacteroidota bacterium]
MKNAISGVMAGTFLWAILLLTILISSPLVAGDDKPTGSATTTENLQKCSGTVVQIDTNNASIKIRPRRIAMTTNLIDEVSIPTSIVLYDDSTKFFKAAHKGATITDLQTNDYVLVSFNVKDEKKIAAQIIWGMPGPGPGTRPKRLKEPVSNKASQTIGAEAAPQPER